MVMVEVRSREELARLIDHTVIRPTTRLGDVVKVCKEALHYGFAAVCVPPTFVQPASRLLRGSDVKVCTAVGFPFGFSKTEVKVFEARRALEDGAEELDMVMNLALFKSGMYRRVEEDIRAVVETAEEYGALVKVIIEACYLTDEEKRTACHIIAEAGADYVKTSTGFGPGGATVEDVRLLKEASQGRILVKAAGGIRTAEQALAMIRAGASRIGTSTGVQVVETFGG